MYWIAKAFFIRIVGRYFCAQIDESSCVCREVCGRAYREWKAEEEVVDDITAVVVYFHKN